MITFRDFLEEARYAPLYHATPLETVDDILDEGLYSEGRGISAARTIHNAKWYAGHEFSLYRKGFVIFELDQNRIRQRYKVTPYDYYMTAVQLPKLRRKEAEEIIEVGTHNYLDRKYITRIHYFKSDADLLSQSINEHRWLTWKPM